MTTGKKPSAIRAKFSDTRKIRNLTKELSREEYKLGMPLLDTAVASVILGFKPSDREMRVQAQRCWEILQPQLNQHLLSEDETVLPWAEGAGGFSPEVMNRIKNSHLEMRSLIGKLIGVSFEEDPDKIVAVAGKALCVLAVKLDDLIDSEELRLLPALRKMLFAYVSTLRRELGLRSGPGLSGVMTYTEVTGTGLTMPLKALGALVYGVDVSGDFLASQNGPAFNTKVAIQNTDLPSMNDVLRAYKEVQGGCRPVLSLLGDQHQRRRYGRLRKADVHKPRGLQLPEEQEHWRPASGQGTRDWWRLPSLQEFQHPTGRIPNRPQGKTHQSGHLHLASSWAGAAQCVYRGDAPWIRSCGEKGVRTSSPLMEFVAGLTAREFGHHSGKSQSQMMR